MLERHGVEFSKQDPARNNTNVEYWIAKGLTDEQARDLISQNQAQFSALRKSFGSQWKASYWVSQGMTEGAAALRVSEIQAVNAAKSSLTVSCEGNEFLDHLSASVGAEIEREVVLCGRFKVDGLLREQKAVIEYFGSFWHMHPDQFQPDDVHRVTGWKAASKWAEDAGRIKYLTQAGYRVFVVWDHEATVETASAIAKELNNAR